MNVFEICFIKHLLEMTLEQQGIVAEKENSKLAFYLQHIMFSGNTCPLMLPVAGLHHFCG